MQSPDSSLLNPPSFQKKINSVSWPCCSCYFAHSLCLCAPLYLAFVYYDLCYVKCNFHLILGKRCRLLRTHDLERTFMFCLKFDEDKRRWLQKRMSWKGRHCVAWKKKPSHIEIERECERKRKRERESVRVAFPPPSWIRPNVKWLSTVFLTQTDQIAIPLSHCFSFLPRTVSPILIRFSLSFLYVFSRGVQESVVIHW